MRFLGIPAGGISRLLRERVQFDLKLGRRFDGRYRHQRTGARIRNPATNSTNSTGPGRVATTRVARS